MEDTSSSSSGGISPLVSDEELIQLATRARELAYAPYSKFKVGAALVTVGGKIYTGCNVESAAYSLTMCAERTAIFKAATEGPLRIAKIAVIGTSPGPLSPCGCCRQMISEFGAGDTLVIMTNTEGAVTKMRIGELLPKPVDGTIFD
ncbi:MAG TPA: cytidine deaminase [Blastocatellia bacterium]